MKSHTASSASMFQIMRPVTKVVTVIMFVPRSIWVWSAYCINHGRIPGSRATPPKHIIYTTLIHREAIVRARVVFNIQVVIN